MKEQRLDRNEMNRVIIRLSVLRQVEERSSLRAAKEKVSFLSLAASMASANTNLREKIVSSGDTLRHIASSLTYIVSVAKSIWGKISQGKVGAKMANLLISILMAVGVLLGSGGAVAYASQQAGPGSILYPAKIETERIEIAFASSEYRRAQLHIEFAQKRMVEIQNAVLNGNVDEKVQKAFGNMREHLQQAEAISTQLAEQRHYQDALRILKQAHAAIIQIRDIVKQALPERGPSQSPSDWLTQLQDLSRKSEQSIQFVSGLQHGNTNIPRPSSAANEGNEESTPEMRVKMPEASISVDATEAVNGNPTVTENSFEMQGTINNIEGDSISINSQNMRMPPDVRVKGNVKAGGVITVKGYIDSNG